MTHEQQLTHILEKERSKELVPFFKSLQPEERKALAPTVKKLTKAYTKTEEIRNGNSITFKSIGSDTQIHLSGIAAFFCLNQKDFEKEVWRVAQIVNKEVVGPILEWFCPAWFDAYINSYSTKEWMPFDYSWLVELDEKGYIHLTPELVVKVLPGIIHRYDDRKPVFEPHKVLAYSRTLEQDIWYLFQHASTVNWAGRYMYFDEGQQKEGIGWIAVLKKYTAEGKIDRQRIIQEALLATTRNFDKTLSGWFAELFLELQPTQEELPGLQQELFNAFNSPHSKPVNTALQCCKTIVEDPAFATDTFMDHAPLLLANDTKSIVSTCLLLLEKLAKRHAAKRNDIALLATQALIHKKEDVQVKAAKLLQKYGEPADETLQQALEAYRDNLLSNARSLLNDFLTPVTNGAVDTVTDAGYIPSLLPQQPLPEIHDTDELIFLASQAFDNNDPTPIDALPAALIRLQHEIKGDVIARLEPALQRAYKLVMGDWRSTTGYLDHLLATFFIDYCQLLVERYPTEAAALHTLRNYYWKKDWDQAQQWSFYRERLETNTDNWRAYEGDTLYLTHKALLQAALRQLRAQDCTPLLSTPTHTGGALDPRQLIDRLHAYQSQQKTPDQIDFQVALSRCHLVDAADAAAYADERLAGEYNRLLQYLLQPMAQPEGPFEQPALWMVAALCKGALLDQPPFNHFPYLHIAPEILTGQYQWESIVEHYTYDKHEWKDGKMKTVPTPATRNILRLHIKERKEKEGSIKQFFSGLFATKKEALAPIFYEWFFIKSQFPSAEANDIQRLLLLCPNHPEPLLAQVTHKCLMHSTFWSESDKKIVNATLQTLLAIWQSPGETAHLFVATAMLTSDKTAASFAAAIWNQAVEQGTINSPLMGRIIGLHERVEYAPLKRFTDLVMNQLLQLSPRHNKELEKLLTQLIRQLPATPIRNLKKLLEVYAEVLHLNQAGIDEGVRPALVPWKETAGLQKVIKTLETRVVIEER